MAGGRWASFLFSWHPSVSSPMTRIGYREGLSLKKWLPSLLVVTNQSSRRKVKRGFCWYSQKSAWTQSEISNWWNFLRPAVDSERKELFNTRPKHSSDSKKEATQVFRVVSNSTATAQKWRCKVENLDSLRCSVPTSRFKVTVTERSSMEKWKKKNLILKWIIF